jgi:hypothetical protein
MGLKVSRVVLVAQQLLRLSGTSPLSYGTEENVVHHLVSSPVMLYKADNNMLYTAMVFTVQTIPSCKKETESR